MKAVQLMLAGKAPDDLDKLVMPAYVSPKLDGIRATVIGGVVMSRTMKPIPNAGIQHRYGRVEYNGIDGELIVGDPTRPDAYNRTQSVVMSHDKASLDVTFWAFDNFMLPGTFAYRFNELTLRVAKLKRLGLHVLPHYLATTADHVFAFEKRWLEEGYEGLMIRHPDSPYKFGRSTTREGHLLKLKRFEDSEAEFSCIVPMIRNGKEDRKRVGAILGYDPKRKWNVSVGSGFTDAERLEIMRAWNAGEYDGRPEVFRYKFFPTGTSEAPRFPTWGGWRRDGA